MQLAVIAKEPVPGRVKTRLCPPYSPEQAARLATAALVDTLHCVRATSAARHVLVLDGEPGDWLPPGFDVVAQRGSGLGERLAAAFSDLTRTCPEPVVLVGMDTPQLTPTQLTGAGALLATTDRRAVLGPAQDGGYWLVGLSRPDTRAFEGVPMSQPHTGRRQAHQLVRCGYDLRVIDELCDIDTAADAASVADTAPGTGFAAVMRDLAAAGACR